MNSSTPISQTTRTYEDMSGRALSRPRRKRSAAIADPSPPISRVVSHVSTIVFCSLILIVAAGWLHKHYTLSFQSPVKLHFQWPIVISERVTSEGAIDAQSDQRGHRLSAWQQYACAKFGSDCRLALAIQRAENPQGKCDIYHYNSDGSLDWGYFQINTVHLERPGVNLRDLLDCKANIDFAHQLYTEKGGFSPWSTFKNGRYREFMQH